MPAQINLTERDENASPRQIAFIERLVEEREVPDDQVSWYLDKVRAHKAGTRPITKVMASRIIGQKDRRTGRYINGLLSLSVREGYEKDHLAAMPRVERVVREEVRHYSDGDSIAVITEPTHPEWHRGRRNTVPAEIGVYRQDHEVYVVRKARGSQRLYATRLVELGRPRLNEAGDTVTHDFVKAPGMVFELREENRITDDNEIRDLCIKVGRCIMCSHAIWQAKSVRRMMGTRCWKRVHGLI